HGGFCGSQLGTEEPMSKRCSILLAALVVLAAAVPALAQPITVRPGNDGWVTPSGGTQVDLTQYPIAAVFGRRVTLRPSLVPLAGSPINAAALGSLATILERYAAVTLPFLGASGSTRLEIQALRLVGNTTGSNGKSYQVKVCMSEFHAGNVGNMTLTLTTPDG